MHNANSRSSPEFFFDNVNAYFRTAALKAAIELNLFSGVGKVGITSGALVQAGQCSPRGIRILSDYLACVGLLCKSGDHYFMTHDMNALLDKNLPGYVGGTIDFLLSPEVTGACTDLTRVVRTGEMTCSKDGALDPEHPQWIKFGRSMAPMMNSPSFLLADLVDGSRQPLKVLDVVAGHGLSASHSRSESPRRDNGA